MYECYSQQSGSLTCHQPHTYKVPIKIESYCYVKLFEEFNLDQKLEKWNYHDDKNRVTNKTITTQNSSPYSGNSLLCATIEFRKDCAMKSPHHKSH
jgi:hypothetical protein